MKTARGNGKQVYEKIKEINGGYCMTEKLKPCPFCGDEAEQAKYDIIIIDSLSHAWSGQGGLLDSQNRLTESKYRGNSYAAWREITPIQNMLVDGLIASPCHIIATMRSKTEYVQNKADNGRTEIHKVGLAPVQRDGIDYEFGTVFDLSPEHNAVVSKDRTGIFDGKVFGISQETGKILHKWLDEGVKVTEEVRA